MLRSRSFSPSAGGLEILPEEVMRRLGCFQEGKEEYGDS